MTASLSGGERPIVGVTLGDPAGVGPEISLRALTEPEVYEKTRPVVIGDRSVVERTAKALGMTPTINIVKKPSDGKFELGAIDLYDVGSPDLQHIEWGKVQPECGRAAFRYVEKAVELALAGEIQSMATAPLNKEAAQLGGVKYLDHTTALTQLTNSPDTLTMFTVRGMRIFFMVKHTSMRKALDEITQDNVHKTLIKCHKALVRFGIPNGKIAVAALNPHAGEHGMFGREEIDEIAPGIEAAREDGVDAYGPIPADAVFHQALQGRWDGVLSLHHDQGHIAAKTIDFERTISVAVGMPFIRTSVDHGTAFDIAGKGIAHYEGMTESILLAAEYGRLIAEHDLAAV
ncbi:MAG: 4-hydroxythreonine-4-phosphate dehydrogenase PdxA [Chloroflexi bacterium]|nr:4-hydroxythreonine-4-phosphate dehydrogenase PdxA [Chloroflexota bacterium]